MKITMTFYFPHLVTSLREICCGEFQTSFSTADCKPTYTVSMSTQQQDIRSDLPAFGAEFLTWCPEEMEDKQGIFSACVSMIIFSCTSTNKQNPVLQLSRNCYSIPNKSDGDANFLWGFWELFSEDLSMPTWWKHLHYELILVFRHQELNTSSAHRYKSTGNHASLVVLLTK